MSSSADRPLYRIHHHHHHHHHNHNHNHNNHDRDHDHDHDAPARPLLLPPPGLPMTPPELDHDRDLLHGVGVGDVTRDLDKLVHRLNRKPIFQDSLRWHYLEQAAREDDPTEETDEGRRVQYERPNLLYSMPMPMQLQPSEPTPALDPIPELSMQCDPCPSMLPPLCDPLQSVGPSRCSSVAADAQAEERSLCKSSDVKRPRRGTDTRLHKSASNLRMLGLVTDMIENGVQCNVQNSTPSPTKTSSTSLALPASMRYIEAQDPADSHLIPGRMQLEIDQGFSELDEETLLNDNLTLRHAGTPAGIRKFGFLRYRSSTEAAQSCKNMKKSVPRMRRRHRSNTASTSESSTSQKPPSTAA
ncbi:hypothetical protein F4859DRAFT_117414 [Xylaria cf. heliscus]|nr:hypothetical protein F4859DRAFT_117414 [Xylaria cf. heliscus]